MKQLLKRALLVLACVPGLALAQGFQGTSTYEIKVNAPNLPAEAASMMGSMMPSKMVIRVKGSKSMTEMVGGMMAGRTVSDGATGDSWMLDDSRRVAYHMKADEEKAGAPSKYTVTKLNETATIAGHTCHKYKVEVTEDGKPTTLYIWAAPDLKVPEELISRRAKGSYFYRDINGMPLKIEVSMPTDMGQMTMTMTCLSVQAGTVTDAEVALPAGYTIKEGAKPMGMGGRMGR